jgi:TonB-linked SusC/RagA family outer membrane protein
MKQIFKVMKITFFLLLVVFVQVSAKTYSQSTKFNLNYENVKLSELLDKIEKSSDYRFFYDNKSTDISKVVTIKSNDSDLKDILNNVLGSDLTFEIVNENIVVIRNKKSDLGNSDSQQQKSISGKVKDVAGAGLSGVSVIVKGTPIGVITDIEGRYTLVKVPENALLQFSFVGMKTQEVSISGKNIIDVTLTEESIGLDEVVAVGYGTQRRANLTGAVSQINSEDIGSHPTPNITSALQGLMPGLNVKLNTGDPRATPEINIRGFNSINGGAPLVLVDGIEGQLELINPSDIETVTVLKDAASSAIYGARGSFGVILVTTKKGNTGNIKLNYDNNFGFTTQTNRTDYVSDAYLYGKTVDAAIYGYNSSSFTGYNDQDWETLKKVTSGETEPFYETLANGNKKFFYNTDWYGYLFKKWVPSQNHNISLSGGTDKINGYLSGRYYTTDDINNIATGNLVKYNLKGNLNFKVTNWMKVTGDLQYNTNDQIEYGGTNNGWRDINNAASWLNLYAWEPNFIDNVPFQSSGIGTYAAMEEKKSWRKVNLQQLINTFNVVLTPVSGLQINFDYSNRITHRDVATRLNPFTFLSGMKASSLQSGLNQLSESREKNFYNALNFYGSYTKTLKKDHNLKLLLGYNQEDYTSDYILGTQQNLLSPDLSNFNLGTNILELSGTATNWAVQGYFGRFNYDYKSRYLLEVNGRKDGSSRFPDYSRWGVFPSVSVGWYVSHEKFWNSFENVINTLKLRSSYGKLGNQNVGLYTFTQNLNPSLTNWIFDGKKENYVGVPSPLPSVVTWEKTRTVDLGADLGLLKNKLQLSFDWYQKGTEGMYVSGQPLPSVFGASEPRENIAGLNNKGFELSISYNNHFNLLGSPLQLRSTFSVSNYEAKITKFPNPQGVMSSYWEGERLGDIWGYHIDGQFQSDEEAAAYYKSFNNPTKSLGQVYSLETIARNKDWNTLRAGDIKYVDSDGDGEISKGNNTLEDHGDLKVIGNSLPRFPFGFSLNANWRRIDFSLAGSGIAHQDWVPGGVPYWGFYDRPQAAFIRKDLLKEAWSPENPGGKFPQIYRGYVAMGATRSLYEPNDYCLENVGYLRIKNLTVGYTIPEHLTKKVNIQKLRIYFSGENILTWSFGHLTKYVDPEQAGSGIGYNNPGDATGRSELEEYPYGKIYSLGISISL